MTELETIKEQKWNNFKRELSKILYPTIFEQKDEWRLAYEEVVVKHKYLMKTNDKLKLDLQKSDSLLEDINAEIFDAKIQKIDLSKFKSNKPRKINDTNMLMSQWLYNRQNIEDAKDWGEDNLKFADNKQQKDSTFIFRLRESVYSHFKKDLHVPEKSGKDHWMTVAELMASKFKGDCDDWMTFIYSLMIAYSELYNRPKIKENLFGILCGINMKEGWNDGNHASLLWRDEEGKFYVIETAVKNGSDYIQDSLNKFAVVDYANNIRYGRIVFMSNYNTNYYQPRLW